MPSLPAKALFMAPMVDLSHVAYQELIRSFSGCDLFYSEMLNTRIVPVEKPQASIYLRWTSTHDLIFQILGNNPEKMHASAVKLDAYTPFGIDVNMGCWLKKVTCHGWGAALMKEAKAAHEVISKVRTATKRPLSVKMRIGYSLDKQAMCEFASMLEASGVDFLVLHARIVEDGMSRKARWEYIAALKDHVKIPVVGNGDIRCAEDALEMFQQTGCDAVMIGRQAVISPWIFRDIKALLAGERPEKAPALMDVMLELHRLLGVNFPGDVALKRFRTALFWLSQNLTFGHHLTKAVSRERSMDDAKACLTGWFERGIF
jgi:tRNA-dihydrouridine synthase B